MNTLQQKFDVDYYLKDKDFYNKLYAYSFSLNKGNIQNTLDLVQDVIVTLKTKHSLYKEDSTVPFIGWARSIMRNHFINIYRRKMHTNSFIFSYDIDPSQYQENIPSHYKSPAELLEDKERLASVEEIKEIIYNSTRLKNNSKKALLLKMEGLKIKEIAKELNIPFNTAKGSVYTEIRKVPEFEQIKDIFYAHHK